MPAAPLRPCNVKGEDGMSEGQQLMEALESRVERRSERREFFKAALGVAAVTAGGFAFTSQAAAQTVTDNDILNFALNLEYLEANFYYLAVYGTPIPLTSTTGTGTQGVLNAAGARAVTFADPIIAEFAREIAADELAHVNVLRQALGTAAVAQPAMDLSVAPTSAFSTAARAAFDIPTTASFDPYANDLNFLYGAYIFEDVGVTAYKGASPLITSKAYLDVAAGILSVEAHHAGLIRTQIDLRGDEPGLKGATVRADTELVSNARDSLDGTTSDLDQGIAQSNPPTGLTSNIVPTDGNGLAFSRTTGQVLNIVYLTPQQRSAGGFFPQGVNGTIVKAAGDAVPAAA